MIRRAIPEDGEAIARLAAQLGGGSDPARLPARLRRIMDQATQAVFVAEGDAGISGFIVAEHRIEVQASESVELTTLVVDDGARRQGLGAQLVAAAEAWAMRRGVARIVVRSNVAREAAHGFYPALGYGLLKTQHVYAKSVD
ncbi:MAG: GNAT family N-acetyltransferase [Luteimonas sp.]|nr:GNAT family N-acetyltransferase [Luteimonas sp.]